MPLAFRVPKKTDTGLPVKHLKHLWEPEIWMCLNKSINILGDFNLAGELWTLLEYYKRMGVHINATITGDGRVNDIRNAHKAQLNVVQCSGSMMYLAKMMKEKYGIPFIKVSYFGAEDMSEALYEVARFFQDPDLMENARNPGEGRADEVASGPGTL